MTPDARRSGTFTYPPQGVPAPGLSFAMLPPADATVACDSDRSEPRPPSRILQLLVAAGVGILVLLGWSAVASASTGDLPSPDGLTGAVAGTVGGVVAPVTGPSPTVPPLPAPPVSAPPVAPPPVVAPVAPSVPAVPSVPDLPVPAPSVSPTPPVTPPTSPTDLFPAPPVPSAPELPAPPTVPGAPSPEGAPLVPPADGLDGFFPPFGLPERPLDGLPAVPGSITPATADQAATASAAAPSAATDRATAGIGRAVGQHLSSAVDASSAPSRLIRGLAPESTPSTPRPSGHDRPAAPGTLPSCGTSGLADRTPTGGPAAGVLAVGDRAALERAHALLDDEAARASSIARARPGFAPD